MLSMDEERSPSSGGVGQWWGREERLREWRKEKREERRWLTKMAMRARKKMGMESDEGKWSYE